MPRTASHTPSKAATSRTRRKNFPNSSISSAAMASSAATTLTRDPVCGMSVDPATAKHRTEHAGKAYYFCGPGCLKKFETAPEKYLGEQKQETGDSEAIYTCPMHSEIRKKGPGSCPICGMALEPL